jgi:MHS family proline/betaine transporter-like MFS transporter
MNKRSSIFLSAILGNILEYYDFTVYAVFAVSIAQNFFPSDHQLTQILASLGVFAVGFLTRPLGGVLFGHIADKYGRRIALILSMLGMTIPTFAIGLIPSYQEIGMIATVTLIAMRLVQGLCISGEGAGAAIFILEHYQHLRPGLTSGIVHASNIAGTLLATILGIVFAYYFPDNHDIWRVAFLLGGFMGVLGFLLRLRVSETPIFMNLEKKHQTLKAPFAHMFAQSKKPMLITFCIGACASSVVYLIKTYINVYYCNMMGLSDTVARSYLAYSSIIIMLTMPVSGYLSDQIGRFQVIRYSALAIILFALPAFLLMGNDHAYIQLVGLTLLAILAGLISGAAYVFIILLFPPEQRFSGVAFSYNSGIALCGGTSAAISCYLVNITGKDYAPAFYIMIIAAIFILVSNLLSEWIEKTLSKHEANKDTLSV